MASACILVKSPNVETYKAAAANLLTACPGIKEIRWIFLATNRDDALVAAAAPVAPNSSITTTIARAASPEELPSLLKQVQYCDVSGLPKEDLIRVVATLFGRPGVRLYTLTRDSQAEYIDLFSENTIRSLRRSYLSQRLYLRTILVVIALGLVSLVVLQLVSLVPQADRWATWLGIFLSLLSLFVGARSLRSH